MAMYDLNDNLHDMKHLFPGITVWFGGLKQAGSQKDQQGSEKLACDQSFLSVSFLPKI